MKMTPVFVWSRRKDKNIVNVGDAEGEVSEDIIHHALKGGPSVSEAKAGVIKCVSPKEHGDGCLPDIGGIHGDLIVILQKAQLREGFCPLKIGCDIGDVGERVMTDIWGKSLPVMAARTWSACVWEFVTFFRQNWTLAQRSQMEASTAKNISSLKWWTNCGETAGEAAGEEVSGSAGMM